MHRLILCVFIISFSLISVTDTLIASADDVIRSGDSLIITVKRHSDLDRVVTVSKDGNVTLPLVGEVKAEGVTYNTFKKDLLTALRTYIKNPELEVKAGYASQMTQTSSMGYDEEPEILTKIIPLKNSNAESLIDALSGALSDNGTLASDIGSNSLIISDTAAKIVEITNLVNELESLDKRTQEVLIEAEIIELTITNDNDLQFDLMMQHISRDDFMGKYNTPVSLPMAVAAGQTGNIGRNITQISDILMPQLGDGGNFFFGKVISKHKYSSYINAMVRQNKGRIVANPKIVVENNQRANIQIITSYPYRELSGSGLVLGSNSFVFTTKFLDYGILLPVTPHIRDNGKINLEVAPEVSFIQGFNENVPIRVARKATTKVNIMNNKTLVIGGLINEKKINRTNKIPILGDIPFIGTFFRQESEDIEKNELIIFITPRILDDEIKRTITQASMKEREKILKFKIDHSPYNFKADSGQFILKHEADVNDNEKVPMHSKQKQEKAKLLDKSEVNQMLK
ncbi:MAG: polysaccharide biosynthesis/export family protein [Candidatus Ancaeobacter aquaticus]|nr:polysaccharide biosynthesis/export family protein [Candidatus Ancaeobacter aquaticus]